MELYNADCLEQMTNIEPCSIDMILCDLPYECTHTRWNIPRRYGTDPKLNPILAA